MLHSTGVSLALRLHQRRHWPALLALLLSLVLLLSACGSSTTAPTSTPSASSASVTGTFTGVATQTGGSVKAYVGLVSDGQQFLAYLCDGRVNGSQITVAQWFKGAVSHNAIQVTNATGSQLVANLAAQSVSGTVTLSDGRTFSFQASLLASSSPVGPNHDVPGLYRDAETFGGVPYLAGTVVLSQQTTLAPSPSLADLAARLVVFAPIPPPRVSGGGGGIINEQTGALHLLPKLAQGVHDGVQVSVLNLGTFTLHLCQQPQC